MNQTIIIALAAALLSSVGSWFVTASIKNTEIATIEKQYAERDRDDATATLKQFKEDAKIIHDAATKAQIDLGGVKDQLAQIRKGNKNAKALPAGCVPDPVRMRSLTESVNAVNAAIAR